MNLLLRACMSKITKSAKGEECEVRIPTVCNFNPDTVIFAHINGGGLGMKRPDTEGAYCCSDCHDVLDLRRKIDGLTYDKIKLYHHEAAMRTRKILIDKGLIKIED